MNTSLLDSLPFNNQEFLEQRQVDYLDLTFLKKVRADQKNLGKTFYQIAQLIDKLNPKGIPPHFNIVTGSERPLLLPELKGDNLPIFIAADRQGILWVRPVYVVNGLKQPQTARDGGADNIVTTDITAIDVASFLYGFDGTDWDRLRTIVDNADNLVVGNPGHLGTMAKLLGFDGTNWDRVRTAGNDSDALATSALGSLNTNAFLRGFNGTSWDRLLAAGNNFDARVPRGDLILQTYNFMSAFNGTNWDRVRSGGNNADNLAAVTLGNLNTNCFLYGFDGTTWDRLQSGDNNADARTVNAARILQVQSSSMGFNGTTWDRIRSGGSDTETQAYETLGNVHTIGYNYLDNGASWDRGKSISATNAAASAGGTSSRGSFEVALKGNWSVLNYPATNTAATATKAAGGVGFRHILTSLHFSLAGAAALAASIAQCQVRDGTTGAGTIIWSGVLAAPIAANGEISLGGLSIVGTANTAMTIEFSGASGAGTQQSVSATGYTVA